VVEDSAPASLARPHLRGPFLHPLDRREALRWLLIALGGFVAGQLLSTVFVAVAAAASGHSGQLREYATSTAPPGWYVVAGLLGLWAGFALAAWGVLRSASSTPRSLNLSFRPFDLLGLPLGLLLQLAIGLAYRPFLHHLHRFDAPIQKLTGGSQGATHALVIALSVLGAPLFEELFFRGVLLQSLVGLSRAALRGVRVGLAVGIAVVLDGLLFGASHGELAQLPGLVAVGAALSLCYLWTGRLGLSIMTHVGFNAVAIAAYSAGVVTWLR
jgi:uncharacterized protein